MRTYTKRTVHLLVALVLVSTGTGALAGCADKWGDGSSVRDSGPVPESEDRAREVADAWDGSAAAEAWGEGFHPMGEAVQLPEGAFRSEDDKEAHLAQNFGLDGELPATSPKDGEVKWKDGGELTLPLMSARKAYEKIARGGGDGPRLTVTGAKPGTMTLATSRGPATVPAWLFTLKGYDTPLKRVAVAPSKLPKAPVKPAGETPTDELSPLEGLVRVSGDGRSVTVSASHGACDDGPAVNVVETDGSVVLFASVVGTDDGPCTKQMLIEEVTVKLDRPLGDRVLLDAFTGLPVPYGRPYNASPSWR